jgi:hypothetical protein
MPVNSDFKELLSLFNDETVEYLVVGAHAVMFYCEPRYTKDIDIWVNPTPENAARVHRSLERFGAPLAGITPETFADPNLVYQMGVVPNRIDIVMGIEGVEFVPAWAARVESTYDGVPMHIISGQDLIRNKRAVGRPQDLLDVSKLERAEKSDS